MEAADDKNLTGNAVVSEVGEEPGSRHGCAAAPGVGAEVVDLGNVKRIGPVKAAEDVE